MKGFAAGKVYVHNGDGFSETTTILSLNDTFKSCTEEVKQTWLKIGQK